MAGPALRDVVTFEPRNVETPRASLALDPTPVDDFYVRSHFPAPEIAAASWSLRLPGGASLSLDDVRRLPQREVAAVLECAGNGRTRFRPVPPGTPWAEGAVACARFGGASLAEALRGADLPRGTTELVFAGADAATVNGEPRRYERSLPLDVAMRPDTLLCTTMNGAPLTRDHGAPVRLLVPSWYGVASVKWLTEVRASAAPFAGHYQANDYLYKTRDGKVAPVTTMRVKSIIVEPAEAARAGHATFVAGWAWSGEGGIARVDVSTDGGASWREAELAPSDGPHAWRAFRLAWTPAKSGVHLLASRARDAAGNEQPWEAAWNAMGYGQNAIAPHRVLVMP